MLTIDKEELYRKIEESLFLPRLPEKTRLIFLLLSTPSLVNVDLLAEKLEEDAELKQLMLSRISSGYFGIRSISDIKQAVTLLGLEAVQNLLIFFIAQKFFEILEPGRSVIFSMKKYWRHVLATSVAADLISERLGHPNRYRMFTYGLNHDIGLLAMNACLPEELDAITTKIMSGIPQIVAEKAVLGGTTHDQIGAWLCERWNFTPEITRVVQYHHTPFLCKEDEQTIYIMFLADTIGTNYYEKLLNIHNSMYANNQILNALGLTFEDQQEIGKQLPERVDKLVSSFIL